MSHILRELAVLLLMQEYAFFLLGVRSQTFMPLNASVALSSPAAEPLWNRTACVKLNAFLFMYNTCDCAVTMNFMVCPSKYGDTWRSSTIED